MNKKYILIIFILVALVQIYLPAKMIFDRESILHSGKEFRFIVEPVDPNDPFRGKYITLDYKENMVRVKEEDEWASDDNVYILLTTDSAGYAKIKSLSKTKPVNNSDFIQAKISYVSNDSTTEVYVEYPFDRFYMEESKAPDAERIYNESRIDSSKTSWALVSVKDGEAVLKDVLIDGVSIVEIVKAQQHK